MKNQLSLFNIRLPLLLGASLFLLSCASTDSTTTVSNETSPPIQTEVLSEEWIENDKATNFLPLSRQFKHSTKDQTANWVQIKHSKGTYPAIDSLKMPLENFFKTKFTSVDESQTTKSQFIDREALIFSLTGKKEDLDSFEQ